MGQSGFSRRHLLQMGAAASLLGRARAEAPPAFLAAEAGTSLLTTDVRLNGQGPYHFVVDTGADRTVLADTVARDLLFAASGKINVQGIVRTVEAPSVRITKLEAGPVRGEALDVPILPRELLQADGFLGLDVLDGHRVVMDFREGVLRLLEPRPSQLIGFDAPREVPVKLSGSEGRLRSTQCLVDGVRCTAFIDTGAEISVGNGPLYRALAEKHPTLRSVETIPLTGVTGGVVAGDVVALNGISLGGLSILDSRIAIADLQVFRLWDLAETPALFIGMNWLHRFNRVAIDYGRKEMRFDLAVARPDTRWKCNAPDEDCHYRLGSPYTIPRPSVAT
ncbi:putative aspartyl protease [Rhizomicrobium palustre]|uniref:Putative aspartyl protease n=1 Tax=Rhizomicrobium palustre TaxID=189966 RepID=A0A846N214_9PROT|nr:retroviral-like aspartic protease family protein [Rhizomicrobium palustre]NIK89653.1 putative aspartyl protease [Rhizomicrobium palustre]